MVQHNLLVIYTYGKMRARNIFVKMPLYVGKSISELQIQVATYILSWVRETVTARWQHYLILLSRETIGMRMTE